MASLQSLAIFAANGHGTTSAYCSGVSESPVIEGDESESKFHSTFYPTHVIESKFTISLHFRSEEERNKFSEWMHDYAKKLASGTANSMQVTVPAIEFMSFGVPVGDFEVGLDVGRVSETMDVEFERMEGLVKITQPPEVPFDAVVATFYPSAVQVGSGTNEEDLYDQKAHVLTGELTSAFEQRTQTSDEGTVTPWYGGPPIAVTED